MATATFDTLKFAKMLKAVGVPDLQAEGQAEAFSEVIKLNFQELATKDDLSREGADLRKEIADLRKEQKADIANLRKELKADIANLRKDIKHDLTALDGKFTALFERIRGEPILVRWMFGLVLTSNLALFIRLVLFPSPH